MRLRESSAKLIFYSFVASSFVLMVSLLIQWIVYDDWMHETGPLRIVGTSIAAAITFAVVLRWQYSVRQKRREMLRRFEKILDMNDRIRNALQAIECVTYLSQPEATESVRQSVNAIDAVLSEVLEDARSSSLKPGSANAASASVGRKSA
jgi:hypothetical protein